MATPDGVRLLEGHGVVPVVRTPTAELALRAVEWLKGAGIVTFEITLTIPGALEVIRELAADPALHVGAGTVLDASEARTAMKAGARYVVSPAVCADIVAPCRGSEVPCVLGAATPTEVVAAVRAGADAVKIFPVSSLGGIAHVRALKAVFPEVAMAPTGGIALDEIAGYLGAGAAFVGVGGRLVDVAALERGARDAVESAARTALAQVAAARA